MPRDFHAETMDSRQISFALSNDARYFTFGLLLDEDRYYSQGMNISYIGHAKPIANGTRFTQELGQWLGATEYANTMRLAQNIFTPNDLAVSAPLISDDRPFAGWLHLDLGQRYYNLKKKRPSRLHIQFEIGLTGPASLADELQIWFHEYRRETSDHPELDPDPSAGWAEQYGNEGLPYRAQLSFNYSHLLLRASLNPKLHFDLGAFYDLHFGSIYGNYGMGLMVKFGKSSSTLFTPQKEQKNKMQLFLTGQTKVVVVGWNQFLDGGGAKDLQLARLLWQNELGIVWHPHSSHWEFSYVISFWSRETVSKPQNPFQAGNKDYRPKLQERERFFDHSFGTFRVSRHF